MLLGASGFLGRNILRESSGTKIISVSRNPAAQPASDQTRWVALQDWILELNRLKKTGPVSVIHAIAITDHHHCEQYPDEAMEVNGHQVAVAAQVCRDLEVPFLFVCTDGLFPLDASERPPRYWSLKDRPDPVSAYGRSKLCGELALADLGWGHSLRMSFVGPGFGTGRGLISFLARRLLQKDTIPGYVDNWFTPAPAQVAASRLLALATRMPAGHSIRQWGSWPALTKYEYLAQVARAAGFVPNMESVQRVDSISGSSVQLDQSLACEDPWSLAELIGYGVEALRLEMKAN